MFDVTQHTNRVVENLQPQSPYAAPATENARSGDWFAATRLTCTALAVSGLIYALLLSPVFWIPVATLGYAIWGAWISIAMGSRKMHQLWFWCASAIWHAWLSMNTDWAIQIASPQFLYWHCRIHLLAALTVSIIFLVLLNPWIPIGKRSRTSPTRSDH